jgi:hypothetical protein
LTDPVKHKILFDVATNISGKMAANNNNGGIAKT